MKSYKNRKQVGVRISILKRSVVGEAPDNLHKFPFLRDFPSHLSTHRSLPE